MSKIELTIIIPTVAAEVDSSIIKSYLESGYKSVIKVQFVLLLNSKKIDPAVKSSIKDYGSHSIITVANDRHFGSCEENLYRTQDFTNLFKGILFCVGEHDVINWAVLHKALHHFDAHSLGAMAWNLSGEQLGEDGAWVALDVIAQIKDPLLANRFVEMLIDGVVLPARVGSAAMLSVYGPIDWFAYLGCHLVTRSVFKYIMQYQFSESVYSFVYKQAVCFNGNDIRYGFFAEAVISRRSEEFLHIQAGTHSSGWLENHRTNAGAGPVFWVTNLAYLTSLENRKLADLIGCSQTLAQGPSADGGIAYSRGSMLRNLILWSFQVIHHHIVGRSHYFPAECTSSSLRDMNFVRQYGKSLAKSPLVTGNLAPEFGTQLAEVSMLLDLFLDHSDSSNSLLLAAQDGLVTMQNMLGLEVVTDLNDKAFRALLDV